MKEIALFGCGSGLDFYLKLNPQNLINNISVIFDNNPTAKSNAFNIDVVLPINIGNYQFDQIIITSRHYVDIYNQLVVLGVPEQEIDVFAHLINFSI